MVVSAAGVGLVFPGGTIALHDVAVDVAQGTFVSLVGPSGCGKSTLLRLVAGLLQPTTGTISVSGCSPAEARRVHHNVSFVFQDATLLPWRTVAANVRLPFELDHTPRPIATRRVEEALTLVGLQEFARAYPHQLSGGMRMRVSLARALASHPDLLLLDEPFAALDEITRQRLNEELLRLWERDRWTALFVTHNVYEAVFLSTRVLVMSRRPGRIVADLVVPFDHPRSPQLRATPAFAALAGEVSQCLRREAE